MTPERPNYVALANGVTMPVLGYGTWPIGDREVEPMVASAIGAGYRLIDTAEMYRNEEGVGRYQEERNRSGRDLRHHQAQ